MRERVRRGTALSVVFALLLSGCGERDPSRDATVRPSDGILDDPELQAVVELQARREGTALVGLLSSPRAAVRARAAFALASVQDRAAAGALAAALKDSIAAVRADAAFALGQTGESASVAVLAEAFRSESDPFVRVSILDALGRIPTREAPAALLTLPVREDEEVAQVRALARLGAAGGQASQPAQDHLLARLDHSRPAVRSAAAYYFARFPNPEPWATWAPRVREVLDRYEYGDPAAMHLVQALGRLGDPSDGERLRAWVAKGRDWRTRANAAAALGNLPPERANREALFAALEDPWPLVAVSAAHALARGGAPPSELARMKEWIGAHPDRWQAAAPLLGVLARADEQEYVLAWVDALAPEDAYRWSAGLQALAFVPGPEALERLRRGAASSDPRIQGAAVTALQQRWSQDRMFAGHAEAYFAAFSEVLRNGGAQAAFSAAQVLSDPAFAPLEPARVLVEAYRRMSTPRDREPMLGILESLGRIGSPEAQRLLEEAALEDDPRLRRTAAAALRALGAQVPQATDPEEVAGVGKRSAEGSGVDWSDLASLGRAPTLRLETERGTVVIRLLPEEAPYTVQAVARLAREGAYDGTWFHRVVPNFVAQGGDIASGDGFGNPGFTLPSEFTRLAFGEGVVGMASAGKDTESSQFFITHSAQPHLDGAYTAFGWVEEGMDVVGRLMLGDRILKATVARGR